MLPLCLLMLIVFFTCAYFVSLSSVHLVSLFISWTNMLVSIVFGQFRYVVLVCLYTTYLYCGSFLEHFLLQLVNSQLGRLPNFSPVSHDNSTKLTSSVDKDIMIIVVVHHMGNKHIYVYNVMEG